MTEATDKAAVTDERDRQWHDALWKALPEMPRGASDKHAPDSPETVGCCIRAVLADVQADLARVVAERDAAREEAEQYRIIISRMAVACRDTMRVVDECYEATGHIRVAKTSEQRQSIKTAIQIGEAHAPPDLRARAAWDVLKAGEKGTMA